MSFGSWTNKISLVKCINKIKWVFSYHGLYIFMVWPTVALTTDITTHLYPNTFLCIFGDVAGCRYLHFRCEVFGGVLCGLRFRHDEQCVYCDRLLDLFSSSCKTLKSTTTDSCIRMCTCYYSFFMYSHWIEILYAKNTPITSMKLFEKNHLFLE